MMRVHQGQPLGVRKVHRISLLQAGFKARWINSDVLPYDSTNQKRILEDGDTRQRYLIRPPSNCEYPQRAIGDVS